MSQAIHAATLGAPFQARCGANGPNTNTSTVPEHATCGQCVARLRADGVLPSVPAELPPLPLGDQVLDRFSALAGEMTGKGYMNAGKIIDELLEKIANQPSMGSRSLFLNLPENAGLPGRGVFVEWGEGRVSAGLDGGPFVGLVQDDAQLAAVADDVLAMLRSEQDGLRARITELEHEGEVQQSLYLGIKKRLGLRPDDMRLPHDSIDALNARIAGLESSAAAMREALFVARSMTPAMPVDILPAIDHALAPDAGRALHEELVGLRALMMTRVEEIQTLRAEVACLGAELRQARFVASGEAGDRPAEHVVRRNGQLLAALQRIQEVCCRDIVEGRLAEVSEIVDGVLQKGGGR